MGDQWIMKWSEKPFLLSSTGPPHSTTGHEHVFVQWAVHWLRYDLMKKSTLRVVVQIYKYWKKTLQKIITFNVIPKFLSSNTASQTLILELGLIKKNSSN